jgi:hypothetical protein
MFSSLRKKSYFRLQYFVAVSNFLTSLGSSFGICQTGTTICWAQGFLTNIFTLSSVQWATLMTLSLFSIMYYEKQLEITYIMHMYAWIPPLLATFLPLINATYGNMGNWCWVISTKNTPVWAEVFWFWFSFYGWIWLGNIIMLTCLGLTRYKSRKTSNIKTQNALLQIIQKLELYPIVLFLTTGLLCISDTLAILFNQQNQMFIESTLILACLQGFLVALIFWFRDDEALNLVKKRLGYPDRGITVYAEDSKKRSEIANSGYIVSIQVKPVLSLSTQLTENGTTTNTNTGLEME